MYQLMKAMDHMHRNGIFHRDIKVGIRAGPAQTVLRTGTESQIPVLFCLGCALTICCLALPPQPENILIMDDCLKLADFGSCRGIYSKQPYTEYISTRWYRAPECLLTDGYYNYKMDM